MKEVARMVALAPRPDSELLPSPRAVLQWRCRRLQRKGQSDHQTGVWVPHLRGTGSRFVSRTWRPARTKTHPQILLTRRLFHRQGDQFIPQAIKDTLPYFLGAVDEEHFLRQNELDNAILSLRELEARRGAIRSGAAGAEARVRRSILDARRVGLIEQDFEPIDIQLALRELKRVVETDFQSPSIVSGASEVVTQLENELHTLHRQLEDVQNDVRATKHFLREQTSYSREVGEQRARLASLALYTGDSDTDHICPLCEARLETPTPGAADLSGSLRLLDSKLEAVGAERPYLQERLSTFDGKRLEIEKAIVSTQRELERAYAENERARLQRDETIERARVVGRVSAIPRPIEST